MPRQGVLDPHGTPEVHDFIGVVVTLHSAPPRFGRPLAVERLDLVLGSRRHVALSVFVRSFASSCVPRSVRKSSNSFSTSWSKSSLASASRVSVLSSEGARPKSLGPERYVSAENVAPSPSRTAFWRHCQSCDREIS